MFNGNMEEKPQDAIQLAEINTTIASLDTTKENGAMDTNQTNSADNLQRYPTEQNSEESTVFSQINSFYLRNKRRLRTGIYLTLFFIYLVYLCYCMSFRFGDEGSLRLLICSLFGILLISWRIFKKRQYKRLKSRLPDISKHIPLPEVKVRKIIRWVLYASVTVFIAVFVIVEIAIDHPSNLISLLGIVVFTLLIYAFSKNRSEVSWYTIYWGLALQFIFGLIIMRTDWGAGSVRWTGKRFIEFMAHSNKGSEFVFGKNYMEHSFAFKILPSVVVFCATIELLDYLGVIGFLVDNIGGFLGFCLDTSPAESINAAANIFLGGAGSALVVKDYLKTMEMSELFVVLTSGMASIAGGALALFMEFGIPADALLAASVMSAPAALAACKLYFPSPRKDGERKHIAVAKTSKARNMFEALSNGTIQGVQLVVTIAGIIITFLAMMEFLNKTVEWFGDRAGAQDLTLEYILSFVMYPFAFLMGADSEDCLSVGNLLGIRSLSNIGVSYIYLGKIIHNSEVFAQYTAVENNTWRHTAHGILLENINVTLKEGIMSKRSEVITTYAMCGFASATALGMTIGSVGALVPSRLSDIAKYSFASFVIATLASYYTACIAGLLYVESA